MATMPSSRPPAVPIPPNGRAISSTMPQPSRTSRTTSARMIAMPRTRASRLAPGGGASSPMIRSSMSWRARGGDRTLEVGARGRRVVALGGPGAEDRLRGRLELLLALELLVATRLEGLHRGELAGLGDLDLALLGRHGAANLLHRPARPGRGLDSPAMASRAVSLLALAAVLVALCAPAAAPAQSGPSSPGLGAPEPEETAPAP